MRADMAKVIVERPRWAHTASYPRGRRKAEASDFHAAPLRESMGRGYAMKELNENLQPLYRYIARHVGRPWRLVHGEIARLLSVRNAVQKHVLDHLRHIVVEDVWWDGDAVFHASRYHAPAKLESFGSFRRYYVCPKTGLLREAPRRRKARLEPDPDRRSLGAARELRRLAGVWFDVTIAEIPLVDEARRACFDVVEHRTPERSVPTSWRSSVRGETPAVPVLWTAGRYAIAKRQLSKRELRAYDLAGAA